MKSILLSFSLAGLVAVVGLSVTPEDVAACEFCTIDFCGGTSVCGHGCNSVQGDYSLETCTASVSGCTGEECWAEEQQLPDMTTVALVRGCELFSDTNGVVADRWRGSYQVDRLNDGLEDRLASLEWDN